MNSTTMVMMLDERYDGPSVVGERSIAAEYSGCSPGSWRFASAAIGVLRCQSPHPVGRRGSALARLD